MSSRQHPSFTGPLLGWARSCSFLAFLLAVLVWGAGCGSKGPKNVVTGKVTLNGQPVAGTVTFTGGGGKEVNAPINPDGTYMIPDPPEGENQIVVKGFLGATGPLPGAEKVPGGGLSTPGGALKPAEMGANPPAKYGKPGNGLSFNVTGGKQTSTSR